MIRLTSKGDYAKATAYLTKLKAAAQIKVAEKCGERGVAALQSATPVESGTTAASWYYTVKRGGGRVVIDFNNSNQNKGVHIAVILQYGHGTGTGGWVEGRDYINPAIQPVFDQIVEEAWAEVTRL